LSVQLLAWALEQRTGSVSRKAVLLALANCHNHHTGLCCPSIKRIRAETECSESTVLRSLMDLEAAGLIVREQRTRPNGSKTTTVYRFPHSDGGFPHSDGTPTPTVTVLEPEVRTGIEQPLAAAPQNRKRASRNHPMWDPVWQKLDHMFGPAETRSEQSKRAKVVQSLVEAGATPDEMHRRGLNWGNWYEVPLTENALENHWSKLARKPLRRNR
jgi:hypothetical protein